MARRLAMVVARLDRQLNAEVLPASAWLDSGWAGYATFFYRLAGAFGLYALTLATVGFFTLSAYAVQQRTREIGIRTALGASAPQVLRAVFGSAWRALFRGLLIGSLGAVAAGFVMRQVEMLSRTSPFDPVTYVAVAVLMVFAGGMAAWLPARRALGIQPTVALRYE
jgi:ABC-type antimicrobial peptide transport system permease subunit